MLKAKRGLLYTAILTISVAIIFFVLSRMAIEQKYGDGKVEEVATTTYDIDIDHLNWRGHKWYVNKAVPMLSANTSQNISDNSTQANQVKRVDPTSSRAIMVNVLIKEKNIIESFPLEDYVLAVTLKELPWNFEDEAIKAQMIAARTYIMFRLNQANRTESDYHVTNTTAHQVLEVIDESMMSEQKRERYEELKKLLEATAGKIITYKGDPIDALYFSTSNGETEAGKDYFGADYPYLQSVSSEWDTKISSSYEKQVQFSYSEFLNQLHSIGLIDKKGETIEIKVVERTGSNRIKQLSVNGQTMSAKQFREALGLASTDFSWQLNKQEKMITLFTKGYGHGVGMSQWGAEGMAREGYNYEQILKHYYSNITIESL